eukprot:TRINITY_DN10350_c0_g5_i1.p1 TRINITY_DN10350_c0_g5~~TRINITY_DN10350_c0_g5_i1.p1  ORF type:complete len:171 (+),score=29.04 TRINITY_DN10350_c0_g5_i1:424-936(+)
MAFYAAGKLIAGISCLKKAQYLDPFEWTISFNLGLLHMSANQYASAFHYFSSAINLKPDFSDSYMYLGLALFRLDDFKNACIAFEQGLRLERSYRILLNYTIVLLMKQQNVEHAKELFLESEKLLEREPSLVEFTDDAPVQRRLLGQYFNIHIRKSVSYTHLTLPTIYSV